MTDPLDCLTVSERYDRDGAALFRHACAHNLEGIVEAEGYALSLQPVRRMAQDQVPRLQEA